MGARAVTPAHRRTPDARPQPFFCTSRRPHTRYWRDWSSDVCTSDLRRTPCRPGQRRKPRLIAPVTEGPDPIRIGALRAYPTGTMTAPPVVAEFNLRAVQGPVGARSEERRVGQECRSRLALYPYTNTQ